MSRTSKMSVKCQRQPPVLCKGQEGGIVSTSRPGAQRYPQRVGKGASKEDGYVVGLDVQDVIINLWI